jgi:uncharacterized protein DUF2283
MAAKLTFKYDRQGDILYINKMPPYPEQESEELGDEVIARLNPKPGRSKTSKYYSSQLGSFAAICLSCPSPLTCD